MQSAFLLSGYPRSRLLWLSRFFSIPGQSLCEVDGLDCASNPAEFWERAEQVCKVPVYGNADYATLVILPSLLAANPLCKTVWIDRPILDCGLSAAVAGWITHPDWWPALAAMRQEYAGLFDLTVDYDLLHDEATIRGLWEFLLPGTEFDSARWEYYRHRRLALDATSTPKRYWSRFEKFILAEMETIVVRPIW